MKRVLELAARGRYSVSPNPMVGCVIVRDGAVIGEGFHNRAGAPHAEIEALRTCSDPRGATLYVNLEPCSHLGRTPPCAEAVIDSGVARVVAATTDPNPEVNGRGIDALRAAGVVVETGTLEPEARRLNEVFFWNQTRNLPFVVLKAAMTVDGKLATVTRDSRWITSEAAREKSLELREAMEAILVGAGTVNTDNPRLTRRLGLNQGITPWTRVILDGDANVSPHAQLFLDGGPVIVFTAQRSTNWPGHVEAIPIEQRPDLSYVLGELYARGIRSLVVEGGSLVHSEFIRLGLWQKMLLFIAPMIIGGSVAPSIFAGDPVSRLTDAYRFRFDRVEIVGDDLMITAYP